MRNYTVIYEKLFSNQKIIRFLCLQPHESENNFQIENSFSRLHLFCKKICFSDMYNCKSCKIRNEQF